MSTDSNKKEEPPKVKSPAKMTRSDIRLSPPWGDPQLKQTISFRGGEVGDPNSALTAFIESRSRAYELYIREQERTKRLALVLSAALILASGLIILFAPPGREALSYWIVGSLVITAAGAAGYKRVWGRSKDISFGADNADKDDDKCDA
jgi:hypothetical protein